MTEENSKRLLRYGFTEEERKLLVREVKKLTIDAVMNQEKILKEDLEALKRLENCREEIEKLLYQDVSIDRIIDSILTLLKEIRTNGTPQFARQARLAFIARAFLRTLVDAGYYTSENVDTFMQGISTVSSEFNDDFERFSEGLISREEFNFKYGHLRSGTYDIRSDRYDAMNFRPAPSRIKKDKVKIQKDLDISILTQALEDTQLDVPAERMAKFWISAIEQREYFKFEFTKSLSMVLELIRKLGSILEIRTMDLSWLCVDDFKLYESGCDPENLKKLWMKLITKRRRLNHDSRLILLPEVILSGASVDVIPVYEARPNFITAKTVEGEVVLLDEEPDADITGKIVVVPKAVVYVPVVEKQILWSKRCKDKALVGTVKETVMQVGRSKKWASKPLLDDAGKPVLQKSGKPVLKKSYSVLQDDFFHYMRNAGYTDVERGERGSTEEHLTVTQFKVQREQERLDSLTAQADQKAQSLAKTSQTLSKKVKELDAVQKKATLTKEALIHARDLDYIGKRTFLGNYSLTEEEFSKLKKQADHGYMMDVENRRLKEELSTAKKEAVRWSNKYHDLWYDVKPYLDALHRAPELVRGFLEKILAPKQERTMNVPQKNRKRGQDMEL